MKPSVSIISFTYCILGAVSKKSLPNTVIQIFSIISSRSYVNFHFTFGPMIHFVFIFVKGVRFTCRFLFFTCGCPVVPTSFVKRLSSPVSKSWCLYLYEPISWISVVPLIYLSILSPIPHCFNYCSFTVSPKVG